MNGFGPRLREERERLGMTQRVFGDIGGVEPNAQGKYESGERTPRADYLAALAAQGMDALYVLSGVRTPAPLGNLTQDEADLLGAFRQLPVDDQAALWHLLGRLSGEAKSRETVRPFTLGRQAYLTEVLR
ncbi:helix-turn-helix domain-containing protein [Pseudomonas sp. P1B16]|uniref:helix-turn-helix domain-containing protein n=1 Tax=Pseudomonas TaxID=286 RepID=UPI00164504FB|nr:MULTISPECIES: helix-turn-helix domain-containing protein [unclassified Pseudomonas]MBC3481572.1 helix-turn-helix domain-containing protein [Pseudomonas sp. SWRI77]MBC3502178.1 helix-turn-helix domain-containing protein [Pseudomonas sp. SWRI59]MBC3506076.1 helix-turn-helix domain-containing protein [Pseudomonas sp. SWRI68]UVL02319.1 helix-turn-helix domain-containing protein [Pseudomonas sp. B21-047]WPM25041.1 helix-turn-helix domain-containing protein [Pseudomonas sp. P1B16]